ncbi:mce related protein [Methyloligella halotolerans]|uniref:Mce related protein n=1 Tax=Methyloligella halotolerans TaxID=1177755 RepID=A0A1E2S0K8_9HYPH|nr:MlaD family protein [Methyloligella halotolerans]ODA67859.1 mce related protein [Methyloligella halotolerans]
METRARYILIGAFMLAAIVAVFAFIFWLENAGGFSEKSRYDIRFSSPVSGLYAGSPVLFNGIRAGEVTKLSLDPKRPERVIVSVAVDSDVPIRKDTKIGVAAQGLTGSSAVTLIGGSEDAPKLEAKNGKPPTLIAPPDASYDLVQAAQGVLSKTDAILDENRKSLHTLLGNFENFSQTLSDNSSGLEDMIKGISDFVGTGDENAPKVKVFELASASGFDGKPEKPDWQLLVADPMAQLSMTSENISEVSGDGETTTLSDAQWTDSVPSLINEAVIKSFENAGYLGSVSRSTDMFDADYRLETDLHRFDVVNDGDKPMATIDFVAKVVDRDGKIVGAKEFKRSTPISAAEAKLAAPALNKEFTEIQKELVPWTIQVISEAPKPDAGATVDGGDGSDMNGGSEDLAPPQDVEPPKDVAPPAP